MEGDLLILLNFYEILAKKKMMPLRIFTHVKSRVSSQVCISVDVGGGWEWEGDGHSSLLFYEKKYVSLLCLQTLIIWLKTLSYDYRHTIHPIESVFDFF